MNHIQMTKLTLTLLVWTVMCGLATELIAQESEKPKDITISVLQPLQSINVSTGFYCAVLTCMHQEFLAHAPAAKSTQPPCSHLSLTRFLWRWCALLDVGRCSFDRMLAATTCSNMLVAII